MIGQGEQVRDEQRPLSFLLQDVASRRFVGPGMVLVDAADEAVRFDALTRARRFARMYSCEPSYRIVIQPAAGAPVAFDAAIVA